MATASEDAPALREPSHGRDAEFPCDRLCAGCGRLTAPRDMTPYRPGRAGMRPDPCPHCREVGLVDLGPAAAILALEGILARERPGRASSRRRIARRAAYAGSAVASWGLLFVFVYALDLDESPGERTWMVSLLLCFTPFMMLLVPGALMAVVALRREWQATTPRSLPARWRFVIAGAAPGAAPGAAVIAGPLLGEGQEIIAPISGRPCLAFEVGLREDDDGEAPLGSWLLVEQRSAPLRIGAHTFDADGVRLRLPRRELPWPPDGPDRARAAHFLRARGFVIEDGKGLRIFESRLEAGGAVTAELTTAATVNPTSRCATRSTRPSTPSPAGRGRGGGSQKSCRRRALR